MAWIELRKLLLYLLFYLFAVFFLFSKRRCEMYWLSKISGFGWITSPRDRGWITANGSCTSQDLSFAKEERLKAMLRMEVDNSASIVVQNVFIIFASLNTQKVKEFRVQNPKVFFFLEARTLFWEYVTSSHTPEMARYFNKLIQIK